MICKMIHNASFPGLRNLKLDALTKFIFHNSHITHMCQRNLIHVAVYNHEKTTHRITYALGCSFIFIVISLTITWWPHQEITLSPSLYLKLKTKYTCIHLFTTNPRPNGLKALFWSMLETAVPEAIDCKKCNFIAFLKNKTRSGFHLRHILKRHHSF